MQSLINALAISGFIFSLFSVVFALWVFVLFMAKEKSQHVVQLVGADDLLPGAKKEPELSFTEFDDPVAKTFMESKKEAHKPRAVQ